MVKGGRARGGDWDGQGLEKMERVREVLGVGKWGRLRVTRDLRR